jgi:hypothetical protein
VDLLLAALLVALAVVGARKARRLWLEVRLARLVAQTPGLTPDNPRRLTSGKDLDTAVAAWRCTCGERLTRLGETTRSGLRVVRCTCRACEADTDLYFLLPQFLN